MAYPPGIGYGQPILHHKFYIKEMFYYFQSDPIVQAMGWTLLHSLWQTIVVAMLLRVLLMFISSAHANWRYALSLIALGTVFGLSIWTFQSHYVVERAAVDIKMAVADLPAVEMTSPKAEGNTLEVEYDEDSPFWFELNRRVQYVIPMLPTFVLLWLVGSILVLFGLGISWWKANRLTQLQTSPVPAHWLERLKALQDTMGVQREVGLYFSERVADALTLKHFKPVILLPVGILNALTTAEVEAILLHELAHIRRWDYLVNCFQLVLEVLYFYHPAVWWIARQVRESREHCCDDLALRLGGSNPLEYAQALTNLTAFSFTQKIPFAMNAKGNKKDFTVRIKRLFGVHPTRTIGKSFLSAFLAGLMLLVFTLSARAELLEFADANDWKAVTEAPSDKAVTDATLAEFLYAWLYKDPKYKGKKMVLNAPLEGGMYINISGSSGPIHDDAIPVFILNGEIVDNPSQVKVPDVIGNLDLQTVYSIGLVRGTKAADYGINDTHTKLLIIATNDWAVDNLPAKEDKVKRGTVGSAKNDDAKKGHIGKDKAPKVYSDSMTMEVKYYIRSDDFFMSSSLGDKPATLQIKLSQEDNPTGYPIYILNGKEVPINRYGKFPPSLRKVAIDSLVILGEAQAAGQYGERGQEAGVYLLYDKSEGEKPIGQISPKENREIESSMLLVTDNLAHEMKLSFRLPSTKHVNIKVFDQEGKELKLLANGWKLTGDKSLTWAPSEDVSGTFELRIQIGEKRYTRSFSL